jgi:predicted Zn-dependent peptidase
MAIEKHEFPSGLQVYVEQVPNAHSTTVNIMVGVGGLEETDESAGLSHLLEHCVHKQTSLFRSNEERLDYEQEHQYYSGANTSSLRTLYYGSGIQFEPLFRGLAATVAEPTLSDKHIAEEVSVVTREARMNLDNNGARSYFASLQHMFNHPYGRPVIGYWEALNFDGDQVRDFHATHYALGKIVVAASGAASIEQVADAAKQYLEASSLRATIKKQRLVPSVRMGEPGTYGIETDQHNNVSLTIAHSIKSATKPSLLNEERFAYWTAHGILSDSVAKSLREDRQLSYDGSYNLDTDGHPNIWHAQASVTCEADKIEQAWQAIDEGIKAVSKLKIAKIRRALLAAQGSALMALDNPGASAGRIISSLEVGLEPNSSEQVVKIYKKLKPADVVEALSQLVASYLETEKYKFISGDKSIVEAYPLIEPKL